MTEPVNIDDVKASLEPFAEACAHLHPSSPDDWLTLDGMTAGDWRRAAAIRAALDGMVLVRAEPTEAMIEAGFRAWFAPDGPFFPSLKSEQRKYMAAAYRAMITAAERFDNG